MQVVVCLGCQNLLKGLYPIRQFASRLGSFLHIMAHKHIVKTQIFQ